MMAKEQKVDALTLFLAVVLFFTAFWLTKWVLKILVTFLPSDFIVSNVILIYVIVQLLGFAASFVALFFLHKEIALRQKE